MEQQTSTAPTNQKHLFLKVGFVFLLIFFLMIPMYWIQGLIAEREYLQKNVEFEVANSWGQEQLIRGPILCIPFEETTLINGKPYTDNHLFFLTPDDLSIQANANSETRTKGIFNTVVFTSDNTITGSFNMETIPKPTNIRYRYSDAVMITGITDQTAITNKIETKWNDLVSKTLPGTKHTGFGNAGFHCSTPINPEQEKFSFSQQFTARGSTAISFLPSGKNSDIDIKSNWNSPSFTGRNLPQQREITDKGFVAHWDASEYNRPFADYWRDDEYKFDSNTGVFGVKLYQSADFYQKNMRSAKYAFLVITLSFMVFFFYEMLLKIKIHPIQYIMIGLSLAIFYALLISFTEHFGFNQAYLISAIAVIALIAFYAYAIIRKTKLIVLLTGLFGMLYAYIFVLLQLEDYALLAGSIGLFVILAAVMTMSRKVNWYQIGMATS
jgi:inner membrane protein